MSDNTGSILRLAACNALADTFDSGGAGRIEIYSSAYPFTGGQPTAGNRLVTVTLNNPAFGDAAEYSSTVVAVTHAGGPVSGTVVVSGTAASYRVLRNNGTVLLQGNVTLLAGDGAVRLDVLDLYVGQVVKFSALSVGLGFPW